MKASCDWLWCPGQRRAVPKQRFTCQCMGINSTSALGQLKVADHSNEIPFIPQLLEMLSISGCIVTTDAMGCQTQIAQQIVDDADYVLALKANQGQLHEDVKLLFDGIADGRTRC